MSNALAQAKQAREFILDKMAETLPESRQQLSENAPRISTVQIDIEEDGTILIYATDGPKAEGAIAAIESLTKEPEVGDTYTGRVVKTTQFGAFVELKKGTDGLLHVSNVGPGRVAHIEDEIN